MPLRLDTRDADFADRFAELLAMKREVSEDVDTAARDIIAAVQARGDAALIDLSRKFDRVDLAALGLRVSAAEIDAAFAAAPAEAVEALRLAHARIVAFHERQRPQDLRFTDAAGVELGWRWSAVEAVGLYVPGGTASYPSSVLMNAVPAKVAGVPRIVMVAPSPDGKLNPLVLAAAKRRVFGQVGIDMIAGPSEVLILADGSANPDWIAADLLAQAEHDTAAQSILITSDAALADAVEQAVARQLSTLPRKDIAGASWRDYGAVITTPRLADCIGLVDRLAAEHLEIMAEDAEALASAVRNAGAIFIGGYTPEAVGDYVGGSNHVLPTARSARFSSGLGVLDFMKRTSILKCDAASLRQIGQAAVTLGEAEGLGAHARSVAIRMNAGQA